VAVPLLGNAAKFLPLKPLLRLTAWRYARQHRWQTWLSFVGIALGVMMVVAVDLATSSAQRAFVLSVNTLNGAITHHISGGTSGVPDAVFTQLRTTLGVRRSAPTVSGSIRLQNERFTLLGFDALSELNLGRQRAGVVSGAIVTELGTALGTTLGTALALLAQPNAVFMANETAARLGLRVPATVEMQTAQGIKQVQLVGTLPAAADVGIDQVVLTDIATAQALLGRLGVVDSIDLVLTDDEAAQLQHWLPSNLTLVPQLHRYDALNQMTTAFSTNLLAMSLLALLVAALLIYNTVNLSVVQRQSTWGVLRSLGVARSELIKLVLMELLVLGVLASAVGVVAGLGLGQMLVKLVTRTIDDLYFNLTVTRFLLEPWLLVKGWGLGVLLTLCAGAVPAWRAGLSRPITLQQQQEIQASRPQYKQAWQCALVGLALIGIGYLMLMPVEGSLVMAFAALSLVVTGSCLLAPLLVQVALSLLLTALAGRLRQTQRLALRNLRVTGNRTALAVAALTVAVSITVGVGVMVGSFRSTVLLWLEQTLSGDLQIGSMETSVGISAELEHAVTALPSVKRVTPQYRQQVESAVGQLTVLASNGVLADELYLKAATKEALQQVAAGAALLVSEPLAWQQHLQVGDQLTLFTTSGPLVLPVAGVFYDYTTTGGIVALSHPLFQQSWPSVRPARLVLQAQANTNLAALAQQIQQISAEFPDSYRVVSNAAIRDITLAIFDRTFAITHVLRLLAILVAFVGILSALLALQLQRMREYAMLRASGMTAFETAQIIVWQTLVMGLLAGIFALPLGLLMADILIDVINQRSFGWSMQHELSLSVLSQALLLSVVAALLAAIEPIRRVAAVRPADGMRAL
jgi:putative ABC transport system permease protein